MSGQNKACIKKLRAKVITSKTMLALLSQLDEITYWPTINVSDQEVFTQLSSAFSKEMVFHRNGTVTYCCQELQCSKIQVVLEL